MADKEQCQQDQNIESKMEVANSEGQVSGGAVAQASDESSVQPNTQKKATTETALEQQTGFSSPAGSSQLPKVATTTPPLNMSRFPIRVGLTWMKGERLEAMDYSRTWYPSKIVEIDEKELAVLIHFEGWNQRYDEWVPMTSEKLRPLTRHSERKDKGTKKRRIHPHPVSDLPYIYRAGESVLAKWTDCKKYPAKVNRLLEDGVYEVTFYDGITRQVQAINIQPFPLDMNTQKSILKAPPAPKTKSAFKNISLKLPESVTRKLKSPGNSYKSKYSSAGRLFMKKKKKHSPVRSGLGLSSRFPGFYSADHKLVHKSPSVEISPLKNTPTSSKPMKPEAPCLDIASSTTSSTPEVTTAPDTVPITDEGNVADNQEEAVQHIKMKISLTDHEARLIDPSTDVAGVATPSVGQAKVPGKRTKRRFKPGTGLDLKPKYRKNKLKSVGDIAVPKKPPIGDVPRAKSLDTPTTQVDPSAITPIPCAYGYVLMPFTPSKAFVVEEDHNPYKCTYEGCHKDFRKQSLLDSHIKYYHPDMEVPATPSSCTTTPTPVAASTPTATAVSSATTTPIVSTGPQTNPGSATPSVQSPQARKRRKKTNSVCSTDSDISVSSKGKSSNKRARHLSELSAFAASPDYSVKDLWADVKPSSLQDWSVEDVSIAGVETEEEDNDADVVNCACGIRETSGLMIQCDVCMCWQHFACEDTKGSAQPPLNYVCKICSNTPGVRDGARYLHDVGWERRGELPTFPFTAQGEEQQVRDVACECNDLLTSLHSLKAALHSTRRHIKISKEESDREFQLWQTDWDNWTKPEEDLLTPHSLTTDHAPSPTSSAFLFPPTPPLLSQNLGSSATSTAEVSMATGEGSTNCTLSPSGSAVSQSSSSLWLSTQSYTETLPSNEAATNVTSTMNHTSPSQKDNSQTSSPTQDHRSGSLETNLSLNQITSTQSHSSTTTTTDSSNNKALLNGNATDLTSKLRVEGMKNGEVSNSQISISVATETESATSFTSDNALSPPASRPPLEPPRTPVTPRGVTRLTSLLSGELNQKLFPGPSGDALLAQGKESDSQEKDVSSSTETKEKTQPQEGDGNDRSISLTGVRDSESQNSVQSATQGTTVELSADSQRHRDGENNTAVGNKEDQSSRGPGDQRKDVPDSSVRGDDLDPDMMRGMPSPFHEDLNGLDDPDRDDNDTDTAEESCDPYRNCEHNLLVHVSRVHGDIEKQLEILEKQIIELERCDQRDPSVELCEDNVLNDIPALRKLLNRHISSLCKIQRLAAFQ